MNYIIELILSGVLILFVLFEIVKINLFNKTIEALITGFLSMVLLVFGLYLSIKYGLILDYSSGEEITGTPAELMYYFAIASILTALSFILISILKLIVWKIKSIKNKG